MLTKNINTTEFTTSICTLLRHIYKMNRRKKIQIYYCYQNPLKLFLLRTTLMCFCKNRKNSKNIR